MARPRPVVLILLLLLFAGGICPQAGSAPGKARPVRVLFIGNSYTYVNNLPEIFRALARAGGGGQVETVMAAPGGWRLKDHWDKGDARRILREGRFDFVVLQEQSQLGTIIYFEGRPRVGSDEAFRPVAAHWTAEARVAGAAPVFYLTWPRQAAPGDQAALNHAYLRAGAENGARVAPAGIAWAEVLKGHPEIGLYGDDGSHPSPAGSYLAACAIYAAIFDREPRGLPARIEGRGVALETGETETGGTRPLVDLEPRRAKILQAAAWSAWRKVSGKNGPVDIPPAPAPMLPSLPEGEALTAASLAGLWAGEFLFYPQGPARLVLSLKKDGAAWRGHLEIKYGSESLADESLDLEALEVGERMLTFADPKSPGVAGLRVSFHGVLAAADEMRGTAEAFRQKADGSVRLLGTWRLRRCAGRTKLRGASTAAGGKKWLDGPGSV